MSLPARPNSLQTYQVVLYSRALHPELFPLQARRVVRHGEYELEAWVMSGSHLLRFEHKALCAAELVTDRESGLPNAGILAAFLCAGERDFEHRFVKERCAYMTTVQTETLSENLYLATFEELLEHGRESDALIHRWEDESGPCLSMVAVQRYNREVHAQCFHLQGCGCVVLRTQTIFEHS